MTAIDLDRRLLGAVRFLDATTLLPILDPLDVGAEGLSLIRNRRGLYVMLDAPGLRDHTTSWAEAPDDVPLGSVAVTLTVRDPARRYLARRRTVRLPLNPDPDSVPSVAAPRPPDFLPSDDAPVGSVFLPIDVVLFPAPDAPVGPGWAVVRGTVRGATPESRLAGALVRVVRDDDDAHLGSALSDARGEVLIAVAGIPVTTWTRGAGAVVTNSTDVRLEVIHDAAAEIPDPYDLENRRATLLVRTQPATLMSGREFTQTI